MKQISSTLGEDVYQHVRPLARAVAQSQHHDSITGTEKQHVTDDYAAYLNEGISESQKVMTAAYRYINTHKTKCLFHFEQEHLTVFNNKNIYFFFKSDTYIRRED